MFGVKLLPNRNTVSSTTSLGYSDVPPSTGCRVWDQRLWHRVSLLKSESSFKIKAIWATRSCFLAQNVTSSFLNGPILSFWLTYFFLLLNCSHFLRFLVSMILYFLLDLGRPRTWITMSGSSCPKGLLNHPPLFSLSHPGPECYNQLFLTSFFLIAFTYSLFLKYKPSQVWSGIYFCLLMFLS